MGLGLHGGALAVIAWLLKKKADLTVTDIKTKSELKPTLAKISKLPGAQRIKFCLGRHRPEDFVDKDLIIQNPGVPADSPYLDIAREHNIPIINEAVLFFGVYPGQSIGVTGTRGKSTTATLLHHILRTQIKSNVVAGNIATHPMMAVVDKLKVKSLPVLELSSWQLEVLAQYGVSPHIAIVTNILPDHLNRYKNLTQYKNAKQNILEFQYKNDIAVLNYDNLPARRMCRVVKGACYFYSLNSKVKGAYLKDKTIYFFDGKNNEAIMATDKIKLPGRHNLSNILAAVTAAKLVGIKNANIIRAVSRFRGISYRLEYLTKIDGIDIYNDSASTTPDATLAAMSALSPQKVLLIAGGEDKSLDYKKLAKKIKARVNFLVLLTGSGSNKLIKELRAVAYPKKRYISGVSSLKRAYKLAWENIGDAQVILFSPAAASFNMFANEFDRARQFDSLVYGKKKKK